MSEENHEIAANSTVSSIASPSSATGSDDSSGSGESDKDKRARIKILAEQNKIQTEEDKKKYETLKAQAEQYGF